MNYTQVIFNIAIFLLCLTASASSFAATFTVTNTNDSGAGSLRQAVIGSNSNNEDNTINFDPAIFSTPQKIVLTSAGLEFSQNTTNTPQKITINGPGANLLTISGNNQNVPVITIDSGRFLTLNGVTVSEGKGGILTKGVWFGHQIETIQLINSVVTGNLGTGVRIFNGAAKIINSTIANNTASESGGGIYMLSGPVSIINSTISSNTSSCCGGGIYSQGGTLYLMHATVAFNKSFGEFDSGGGIFLTDGGPHSPSRMTLKNSIIANNRSSTNFGNDLQGYSSSIVSEGFNLIGDASLYQIFLPTDLLNVDPRLDPVLRTNGGTTLTHSLGADSPAIDRGNNCVLTLPEFGGCFAPNIKTDQRGVLRPQEGNGDHYAVVDMGAYEVTPEEIAAAPGLPDLIASDDTGVSNTDNITTSRSLTFNISVPVEGAVIEFIRNEEVIGTKTASGNSVSFTDGNVPADAKLIYKARQIVENKPTLNSPVLTVVVDNTAPKVAINLASQQADSTNSQPVNFAVAFGEDVFGFDKSDLSLSGSTAGISDAVISASGSGKNYAVTVSGISADGVIMASVLPGSVTDAAGNKNEASTSTDNTVTFDTTVPTVTINQSANQTDPTRNLPVNFTVIFSEPVAGFNNADISLAGSTANVSSAAITVTGSGTTYNVAVSNFSSNGSSVMAAVRAGGAFDAAGNANVASISTNNIVIVDNTSPTVTINQAANQIDPVNVLPVNFSVVFSEPVNGFEANDISLTGSTVSTTGAVITVTGSGTNYNVAINNFLTNGGFIRASVRSGAAADSVGNSSFASTSTDNQVTVDNVAPTVNIRQAIGQSDPAANLPINFTVVFSELVTGFEVSDVSLVGSTANVTQAAILITGNGSVYNVSISNITSNGEVTASIIAGAAQDSRGNQTLASFSSDNVITVNIKPSFFDFDGDGKSDISIYRDGMWWYAASSAGGQHRAIQFGAPTDKLVPADYDGDGKTDAAVFRDGTWHILKSSDNGYSSVQFGFPTDIPQPGDYDGDGKADVAVYRPSDGYWYILNSRDGFRAVKWGAPEDKPVAADFDGDGKTDVAVFRPSDGNWYQLRSRDGFAAQQFGEATDKPVVGDYDGDGKADYAVYRPSNGTWYTLGSQVGFKSQQWGLATDKPVPADYDGDGKTDYAVFRDGTWYQMNSATGFKMISFGYSTDKLVPNSFVQ